MSRYTFLRRDNALKLFCLNNTWAFISVATFSMYPSHVVGSYVIVRKVATNYYGTK